MAILHALVPPIPFHALNLTHGFGWTGSVFEAERKQEADLASRAELEMQRYNEQRDEEMARRRAAQRARTREMMLAVEEMKQEKRRRQEQQQEEDARFAAEVLRQDEAFRRQEQLKQQRHAQMLALNGQALEQQVQQRRKLEQQFEEPAEVVTMNTGLLGKIARESEEVDVTGLLGRMPAPPKRVLLKKQKDRVKIGGRGNLKSRSS